MKLRADGSGGGQAVLNFVGLGAELIGQATGWKERACGSAVSSLKGKKSSVTEQLTVECRSQELSWVLRGIFITQRTVFRSDLRISRDNYVVNLMHLCLSRAGFLVTSITFTTWCSLAVTIHCATIASSMWLWTYSRVELESCHFFSIYCFNESVPLAEIFLANDHIKKNYNKDNRCQQSSLWRRINWLSQFSWSWIYLHLLLSLIQPLFFSEDRTLFFFVTFCSTSDIIFCFFFFFKEKSILPI